LFADSVASLFEDCEGNIWAGTQVGLLFKFSPRRVIPLTDLGHVRAVAADLTGNTWVGADTGLIQISRAGRRVFGLRDGLPSADVRALHVDRTGVLWVATASGVVRADRGFVRLPLLEGTWPSRIHTMATDSSGSLWLSDQDQGLLRWKDGHLAPFDPTPSISHTGIDSVATDSSGRVWLVVAGGGLGSWSADGSFKLLRASDAFNLSDLAVYEDAAGTIWFGGGDRLTRFKDGKLTTATHRNGLPNQPILAIADDREDFLWIGTSAGVVQLAKTEFERAAQDPSHQIAFKLYDSSDGLAGMPLRYGYPNAARAQDGTLWFVTGSGVAVVDPRRILASRPAPVVQIETVSADGRQVDPRREFVLPPRTGTLQIEYTAPTFQSPTKVQFRYRLDGIDEGWTDAGTRRQVLYANLPPRSYRFHVIARSSEGIWNDRGAVLDFSIQPTFYQTTWFHATCVVAAVFTLIAGWQWRLRGVRRQFALVFAERARLSREIHDTLLQSLVGVALELDVMSKRPGAATATPIEQLGRLRRRVEQYIREARQSVWDLRSPTLEIRDLEGALREAGERAVRGTPLDFEFAVEGRPHRWAGEVEQQVLRIGQEAINNAVRHARAHKIRAELHYASDSLRVTISDDGRGFDRTDRASQQAKHCGLMIMQERAEQVGGFLTIATHPGAGTNVELVIPLAASS
jgi:signal transduction histidine kinase